MTNKSLIKLTDLVLENSNGVLKKIQVKSTLQSGTSYTKGGSTINSFQVNICKGNRGFYSKGKYAYPEGTVDYFVVHDIVNDTCI